MVSAALPEVSMITYKSDQNLFFWTPFSFTTDSERSSFSSAGTLQCCMTSCSIAMMSECSIRVRALAFFAWELYPLIPEKMAKIFSPYSKVYNLIGFNWHYSWCNQGYTRLCNQDRQRDHVSASYVYRKFSQGVLSFSRWPSFLA